MVSTNNSKSAELHREGEEIAFMKTSPSVANSRIFSILEIFSSLVLLFTSISSIALHGLCSLSLNIPCFSNVLSISTVS